jgi:hypothetical protein
VSTVQEKNKILRVLKFRFQEQFSWPENGFIVFGRYDLVE